MVRKEIQISGWG